MGRIRLLGVPESSRSKYVFQARQILACVKPSGNVSLIVGDGTTVGGNEVAMLNGLNVSFTSSDGKIVTIKGGQVTNISPIDFIESQMYSLTT